MKFISNTLLVSLILLTLSTSSTQAIDPNKYSCGWNAASNPPCFVNNSTCDANHTPGSCELIPNEAVCEPSRIRDCNAIATPPPAATSASCGAAKVELNTSNNTNTLSYCVSSTAKSDIENIYNVTATCRNAPGGILTNSGCHEDWQNNLFIPFNPPSGAPATQSLSIIPNPNQILQDSATGNWFTCFELSGLDRDMGLLEVDTFSTTGHNLCTFRQNVTPGNYTWLEYWQSIFENLPDPTPNPLLAPNKALCGDNLLGVNTALGCLMAGDPGELLKQILGWGVIVGGGVAFLLILYAGFQISIASGDPKKLQAGQELLTSAIIGLSVIVLALVLLNFIGVNILKLPGFSIDLR